MTYPTPTAYYQGEALQNLPGRIVNVWLATGQVTYFVRYERLLEGGAALLDISRYSPAYEPWVNAPSAYSQVALDDLREIVGMIEDHATAISRAYKLIWDYDLLTARGVSSGPFQDS